MEKLQAKCTAIVQAEKRGQVTFTLFAKDNKTPVSQIVITHDDPKKVAGYEQGATYSIAIDKGK